MPVAWFRHSWAVDLVANQPGLTLFHCHNQQHMDFGFKALFRYA
jgi:FtsP/CotA-like multicopper oxidase with cupredoxin domain